MGNVKGMKQLFKVYAHDKCVEENVVNLRYEPYAVTAMLRAAGAPIMPQMGKFSMQFMYARCLPCTPCFICMGIH